MNLSGMSGSFDGHSRGWRPQGESKSGFRRDRATTGAFGDICLAFTHKGIRQGTKGRQARGMALDIAALA